VNDLLIASPLQPRFSSRVATEADRALVVTLLHELFEEIAPGAVGDESKRLIDGDTKAALASADVRIFLLEMDGQAAGLARADFSSAFTVFRLREDKRGGYVDQMFVRRAHRKQKLGKALLLLCENWLRERGATHCLLHAAPNAQGFYAQRGYQSTRELFKKL